MLNKVVTWKAYLILCAICTGISAMFAGFWMLWLYWDKVKAWGDRTVNRVVKLFRR